ncbi:MAG: insulinase family protein, partial [Akkermansiaceae bacterium]|nr:insulinase family protein [Akkermansiaceae bacterium]
LKSTDFKKDQVLLGAFSPGGHSLVEDDNFVPGFSAQRVVAESGLGAFTLVQLEKKLSGKLAGADTFIAELQEGL